VTFSAQSPDLPRLNLGRESFAVICPLALFGVAFYPVSVRRLADSLPASFSATLAGGNHFALRFAWVATTSFPEYFHLQITAHAGRTNRKGEPTGSPFLLFFSATCAYGFLMTPPTPRAPLTAPVAVAAPLVPDAAAPTAALAAPAAPAALP